MKKKFNHLIKVILTTLGISVGIVFAIEISSSNIWTTPANNGDIITADAWNELVSKAKPCESEGEAGCWLRIENDTDEKWACVDGWDSINKQCFSVPLGSIQDNPGTSCQDILDNRSDISGTDSADDGVYRIKPDSNSAFQVYCDMSTDGGGWIKLSINKTSGPSYSYATSNAYGSYTQCSNGFLKTNQTSYADYVSYADASSFCNWSNDIIYQDLGGAGVNDTYIIPYKNFALATNFTDTQLNAIRSVITELNSDTEMIVIVDDDDGYNPGHEVYLIDTSDNTFQLTDFTTGDGVVNHKIWGTSGSNTIPTSYIIPYKINIGHFATTAHGGGVFFGYEKDYILVR